MQTTDELNMTTTEVIDSSRSPISISLNEPPLPILIKKYIVRRLTRGDDVRIQVAIAPLFSVRKDANPESIFEVIYSPVLEDTLLSAALQISVEELTDIDHEVYGEIYEAFNRLNPNFISDVTNKIAGQAILQHALTHNSVA